MPLIQTTDLQIYIASVEPLKNDGLYRLAKEAVSPERRERAERYRFPEDRALSYGAELLLRKALTDCGRDGRDLVFGYGEHGKPHLADEPGFFYSLSHAGLFAMAAVGPAELGCDIERITEPRLGVARRFFSPEEYEALTAAPSEERSALFFRYWTLKESFLKATGLGLTLPLDSFQIVFGPEGEVSVRPQPQGKIYRFAESDRISGYRCAVCAEGAAFSVRWETVDLRELLLSPQ